MIRYAISIVDDEETIRDSLSLILSTEYDITCYEDAESFLSEQDQSTSDLILLDIGLPGMSGLDALNIIKEKQPTLPVIMVTAFEDINMVIQAMKSGAFDFVLKPMNPDILEHTIKKAIDSIALRKEVEILQEKYLTDNQPCFIGESKNIEDIMDFIHMVAKSPDTPIMILGETGTGKELIAGAIHARSPIFQGPFVAVNCSAFPEDLIESELFGYEEGAFSGAKKQGKTGLIEKADNGTLFLDEVADLSLAGQAKLLRFIESGEFFKVGGTRTYKVKVRIVSATNKNIEELVDQEKFRRDLYFRLCVIKAEVPSLNDRRDDIMPLSKHFLFKFNEKFEKTIQHFSADAEKALVTHTYTGNVRELRNIIERAVLISRTDKLTSDNLGLHPKEPVLTAPPRNLDSPDDPVEPVVYIPDQGLDLSRLMEDLEEKYITYAITRAKGNESKAARLLKMNHHTFRYKWKKIQDAEVP